MKMMGKHGVLAACYGLALAGCPTVDLGDTPSDIGVCYPSKGIDYFESTIEPMYLKVADMTNGCARTGNCHNNATGMPLKVNPLDTPTNYQTVQRKLNCGQPMASLLYEKPLGLVVHGGGIIYQPGDPAVQAFLDWFK